LAAWLAEDRPQPVRRQGALLLAEMKRVTPQSLPLLADCLTAENDLLRSRAQLALRAVYGQKASVIGRAAIERLTEIDEAGGAEPSLLQTVGYWALTGIHHDRPDWLRAWAAGQTAVLPHIHYLDGDDTWEAYRELLESSETTVQTALLNAASSLLRYQNDGIPSDFSEQLLALARGAAPEVRRAALRASGHWRKEPDVLLAALRQSAPADEAERAVWYTALARLAARADGEAAEDAAAFLQAAFPEAAAQAAWVRLRVMRSLPAEKADEGLLAALFQALPDGERLLTTLLQAGTDDDGWGQYHKAIVALLREATPGEAGGLALLLDKLEEALAGPDWEPRRMALAAVAACAADMPDALNLVRERESLAQLLIDGTKDAGSHNSRRFGITALSHLRMASPPVVHTLLAACRDVAVVQADAVAAAGRFRHLSAEFAREEALRPLAEALVGESGAAAYVAAQLLAALGRSPAAQGVPGLRPRIVTLLRDALAHPRSQEPVYLLENTFFSSNTITAKGSRTQIVLWALARVNGLV
jgi:hypothetical protein